MSVNDIVDSGIPLPRMATVQPLPDYFLRVKWVEGPRTDRVDLVDVGPAIFGYKVYRPLRDERLFLTATIAEEGDAVSWGSNDLMMSADTIQSLAQESWSSREFVEFLARMKLTQEAAAALLGRSRRQIATYATKGPIPRVITLACYGFESLRRDRFLSDSISQPPTVNTGPVPERSGQDHAPVGLAALRQRA
ncbi:MAG: hypothetical protein ABSH22_21725 [Tepidisphaeraceae bacterium]|jgi:hypothetical protein